MTDWDYWTESPQRREWLRDNYGVDINETCCAPEPNAGHKCWCELAIGHDGLHEHLCDEVRAWNDGDEEAHGSPIPSGMSLGGMQVAHGMARRAARNRKGAA